MTITDISYIDIRFVIPVWYLLLSHMVGPAHSEHWHQDGNIREKIIYLLFIIAEYPEGSKKFSALNIKRKECFHKAQTVCHIRKEYSDSRLIMFSINCFILLGNVPPYSGSVFPSISQHVGSCKSFCLFWFI